ncbi:ribbon-helix-helix protein, CopG family [Fervidicoccus fontis]|uniref:Ribbon-helix-helix protein, CopG family n=1 Tax=Fervidicoccus fontis TaxID=683846 RepID=A0A843A8S0_9CREN|nr:ribbon-helix-helix domain-containing protein [Fervidicoccus fontis]MBE9391728.1 ribbon-helix-helix protein, CopG family [Fervidicoccus fontis]
MPSDIIFIADKKESSRFELIINSVKIVSFRVDENLKKWIESAWKENGFSSRSDYLRNIIEDVVMNTDKYNFKNNGLLPFKCKYTVTFKIDNSLLEKLDKIVEKKGYYTRSDFLRDLFNYLMNLTAE